MNKLFIGLLLLIPGISFAQENLSLEDIFNLDVQVVTASNKSESISEAPATIIVVTQRDIVERGYQNIIQIMEDLPGMQIINTYGATYTKNYMRGYRNTIGAPYLLLKDGKTMNHLYFNEAHVAAAIPLSNIRQIEVVYGPASSIYGANAFMGVVNIITNQSLNEEGGKAVANITRGDHNQTVVDANYMHNFGKATLSVTARLERYDLGEVVKNEEYEWTKDRYYESDLWGALSSNENIGGNKFKSLIDHRGFDAWLKYENVQVGFEYYLLNNGYGTEYPGDVTHSNGRWILPDTGYYVRHNGKITEDLTSKTLLRYRESNVRPDSIYTDAYPIDGSAARTFAVSYWQTQNNSTALYQDFELKVSESLDSVFGFKWESRDLQRDYETSYGSYVTPGAYSQSDIPSSLNDTLKPGNRVLWEDVGIYTQFTWTLNDSNILNLGGRYDDNSAYGNSTVLRGSYILKQQDWNLKVLYGEAYSEPFPRNLYGGWAGSGSNEDLKPEKSKTLEVAFNTNIGSTKHTLSVYGIKNEGTVVGSKKSARNLGKRDVLGADYHFKAFFAKAYEMWAYLSYISGDGDSEVVNGSNFEKGDIPDIAEMKAFVGLTGRFTDSFVGNLRARYVGEINTVNTNYNRKVDAYTVLDMNFLYKNFVGGMSLGLTVNNMLDQTYFHPGVREANTAINTTGSYTGSNWNGSNSYYNSLLPQKGREVLVTLTTNF